MSLLPPQPSLMRLLPPCLLPPASCLPASCLSASCLPASCLLPCNHPSSNVIAKERKEQDYHVCQLTGAVIPCTIRYTSLSSHTNTDTDMETETEMETEQSVTETETETATETGTKAQHASRQPSPSFSSYPSSRSSLWYQAKGFISW